MVGMSVEKPRNVAKIRKELPSWGNFAANQIAEEYAQFVRENYLSGQVLRVQTGETRSSVKFAKMKNGVFAVRPGFGIPGRLNYLLRFERGGRSIMGASWRAFRRLGAHRRIRDRVIAAMLRESGR